MRIAKFSTENGQTRVGVVEGEEVADIFSSLPGANQDLASWLPAGVKAWSFFAALAADAPRIPLTAVTLHVPIKPSKLLGLGANYRCHLEEVAHLGFKPPAHQIWFNKQVSALNDPFADVILPTVSDQIDYEGELGVVIGRRCRNASEVDALTFVGGYVVCNDVSVRDVQMRTPTHTLGKSFDTHAPVGPWLVTADEIPDPQTLKLRTWVNGELRQDASTATMVHAVASQIAELSSIMTLEPGDLITTGTPAGVAVGMQPPKWIVDGDLVKIEIERIGQIQHHFVSATR